MVNVIDLVGIGYILASVVITPVTYISYKNREKLAGIWMMYLSLGIIGVSIVYGLKLLVDTYSILIILDNLKYLLLNAMELFYLLLAIEYTRKEKWRDIRKLIPIFAFLIIPIQIILWTDQYHGLARSAGTYIDANGILQNEFGVMIFVIAGLGYVLILIGLYLLTESYIGSQGVYRKQSGILIIGTIIVIVPNILNTFDLTYLDLTPIGLILTSGILSWGLFRYEFLEMIPIARKQVIDTMDDAAVVLNVDGRILDLNSSAMELLNLDNSVIGEKGDEILSDYSHIMEKYIKDAEARDEISLIINGQEKHFDLNISAVEDNTGEVLGRVIVLRDITELKNREQEIELLKDVQSRVLRHNLRNELGLIRGWAEAFREKYPEDDETFEKMMEIVDKIIERGEKARTIERILDYSQGVDEVEVTKMVEDSVMSLWNSYPEVDFSTEMPDDVFAYAITDIGIGISNLVENAAEHNDADDPRVEVTVRETGDGWVEVEVWDNGSGIPEAEREIIEEGEETPLRHGSGVGLWLVDWVVSKSNGELVFDGEEGNTVTVRLRASRRSTW